MNDAALLAELHKIKNESDIIRRLATALVKTESTSATCDIIVQECQNALQADAVCLHIHKPQGYYEMVAERGCTQEFKHLWYRVYPEKIPLLKRDDLHESLYLGSADDFKKHFPTAENLVEQSKRQLISYAPLVVNQKSIGIMSFAYNSPRQQIDSSFVKTIMNLCAQALERAILLESERESRKEAQSANQAKTAFLSRVSHEIRAPLHTMAGFADLIYKSDCVPDEQKNWALRISKNAQHLGELIGDVLDISKIEADKIEVCKQLFPLNEFIENVKAVTTLRAEEKNIALSFFAPESAFDINSDPIYLRQILINLISNAIKFTQNNGKVDVSIAYNADNLCIQVKDTGMGIPVEEQKRIFEPFIQVDRTSKKEAGGTGLGLSISKRLAIALGGDIILKESALNNGSVFVVNIPCEGFASSKNQNTSTHPKYPQKLNGINALVVDDSLDNQFLIKHILNAEGAHVDTASNGLEGVEKAMKSNYHIIVMDIQMPVLDGNRAISQLRSMGYRKPIVALTAEVLTSQREESLQRGFDDYLSKPLDSKLLIKTVERIAK